MRALERAAMSLGCETVRLRDGRALAYAEFGDPRGAPVIYCHGAPSSRAEGELTVRQGSAAGLGVRVIIPDRPGMGHSDFQRGRRIIDWPSDVLDLADALQIDRFVVLGSSAGAPYALACAALIPERVRAVGIVGGVAPSDAPGLSSGANRLMGQLARNAAPVMGGLIRLQLLALRSQSVRKSMAKAFPDPDRALLERADLRDAFIGCLEECCRHGARGAVWELGMFSLPWGFDLSSITVPVRLWQGEKDGNVSTTHAKYLAGILPTCRAHFYPDDAHLSVMLNHDREILSELQHLLHA
jgi:pimeloyl-ACP methyl ester carboxylesterase